MKKSIALILILAFTACIFVGCGKSNRESAEAPVSDETESVASVSTESDSETRIITDSLGREVEIPAKVETIVPLGNTPRMITYLGLAENVVGISGFDEETLNPLQAYAYAKKELWSGLPVVGTDSCGATDYYPEEIIGVHPDVILCTYTEELSDDIQRQTNIPVVAVPMGTLFGEDYEEALRLLADVCGVSDRAEEVISYIDDCLDDLASRTADVPEEDKVSVLGAAATFKGMHGIEGVYANYPVFTSIAANDVAKGISDRVGGVMVDKEQVLGWNPQMIFLDSGGVNLVKTDYKENPDFYSQLKAVNDDSIYQYPNSTYYYSNVEMPIVNSYYVASIIYPEQFEDVVFEEKANEIFEFFIGDDDYLVKLENSGSGYGKVTLGED